MSTIIDLVQLIVSQSADIQRLQALIQEQQKRIVELEKEESMPPTASPPSVL